MAEVNYMRQSLIFDPSQSHKKIVMIGAGGIGSSLTFCLAKCGFKDITVFDADEVEEHNVPNQLYGLEHCGKPKVEALAELVLALTGVTITPRNEMVETLDQLPMDMDTIYVFALDSLDARQSIYEVLKGSPTTLIDGRMGGEGYQIYVCELDNEESQKRYEIDLYVEGAEETCGMRSIIYTLFSLASEMANQIKRIDAGQSHIKHVTRHMNKPFFIGQ